MEIVLYKFNKKVNSTAVPSSSVESITLSCQVKTPSSIVTPTVQLTKATEPIGYNYAYIPEWGRYYFIRDITYGLGVWVLTLSVDALASFRSDVFASSQYVLRSASQNDGSILDSYYPTKGGSVSSSSVFNGSITRPDDQYAHPTTGYFTNAYTDGFFVLGVISTNDSSNTGVSYYELTYAQFRSFMTNLLTYVPDDFGDLADGLKKSFFDPIQFIVSCRWYPITMKVGVAEQTNSIKIAGYDISIGGSGTLLNNVRKVHLRTTASIPKHPGSTDYPYRQLSPYSDYKLMFEPFGCLALDTTKLYNATTMTLDWYIDNATGQAELFVSTDVAENIAHALADVGVDVPVAQISVDYIGGAAAATTTVGGFIQSFFEGGFSSAIGSIVNGIASTVQAASPSVSSRGATGSFLAYCVGYPKLYLYSMIQVDADNDRYGRPLCAIRTLSALSGFTMCADPSIESTATAAEKVQIENYLTSGVFLE